MDQNFVALLGVVVAGCVTIAGQSGRFTSWEMILGILLLGLLLSIDRTALHTA